MPRPKKRKMGAAQHLIRLAKARRRLRAKRAIIARQAEEHDKLKRQHSDTSAALDKSNQQLQVLLEQQQTLHLAVLSALEKNNQHTQEVSDPMKSAIDTINHNSVKIIPVRCNGFNKLPFELRKMIWEMGLPGRRVFEPRIREVEDSPHEFTAVYLQQTYPPPVIRGVCKEAWEVTETHGLFLFGLTGKGHTGCWFNPSRDLVYISHSGNKSVPDFIDSLPSYLRLMADSGARHLAWGCWYLSAHVRIRNVMRAAPWCETITAVAEAATMDRNSSVKAMYPLDDEDADTVCDAKPDFETVSWAGVRRHILTGWKRDTSSAKKLPQLKGLELVRTKQIPVWELRGYEG